MSGPAASLPSATSTSPSVGGFVAACMRPNTSGSRTTPSPPSRPSRQPATMRTAETHVDRRSCAPPFDEAGDHRGAQEADDGDDQHDLQVGAAAGSGREHRRRPSPGSVRNRSVAIDPVGDRRSDDQPHERGEHEPTETSRRRCWSRAIIRSHSPRSAARPARPRIASRSAAVPNARTTRSSSSRPVGADLLRVADDQAVHEQHRCADRLAARVVLIDAELGGADVDGQRARGERDGVGHERRDDGRGWCAAGTATMPSSSAQPGTQDGPRPWRFATTSGLRELPCRSAARRAGGPHGRCSSRGREHGTTTTPSATPATTLPTDGSPHEQDPHEGEPDDEQHPGHRASTAPM